MPPSPFATVAPPLDLLAALADSLEQAYLDLMSATPAELDRHTVRQMELCRHLPTPGANASSPQFPPALASDLQIHLARVARANRKYAALLRRRRRTVDIFCRVLVSSGTTYPAPKTAASPKP